MTVVDDELLALFVAAVCALAVYVAYLKLFVVRRLRKRMDRLVDERLARPAAEPQAKDSASAVDAQVRRRLEVLERIVTDGGFHTAAQIEALRQPARAIVEDRV